MPLTPPAAGPTPRQRPQQERTPSPARARLQRELIIYGAAVGCGLILMPFLIWGIGSRVLGPYIHGDNPHASPFALFGDFWAGLVHGSAVFWIVALGPAVVILLARSFLALLRVIPSAGRDRRA
ncbi:MAG: hypothetical protein WA747_04390 [Steroidobacteraceae bacterium]